MWAFEGKIVKKENVSPDLYSEVKRLGARDMEVCMQCGNCASACPLSAGENTFPRKIYRYLQLGLRDKLLESPEPWLCYYCGDCNTDCPRGAEPAETMMATRRWLMTQYDWTGIARRFYTSPKTEVGAFLGVAAVRHLAFSDLPWASGYRPRGTQHLCSGSLDPPRRPDHDGIRLRDAVLRMRPICFSGSCRARRYRYISI